MTPEEFRKNCRDLIAQLERDQGIERDRQRRKETRLSKRVDRDGMYVINARLHPELGTAVFNALDAETAKLVKAGGDRNVDRQHHAADALGNLVTGGHQAIRPNEAEVRLHVDVTRFVDGPHEHGVCEYDDGTPVPAPTARRLICNGRIIPIIIDTNGVALNAGREIRLANRQQRRALRAMYRTCAFPGCDVDFNGCEIHHLLPFEFGVDRPHQPLAALHPASPRDPRTGLAVDPRRRSPLTVHQPDGEVFDIRPLRTSPTRATAGPVDPRPAPASVILRRGGTSPPHGRSSPPDSPADQLTLIA